MVRTWFRATACFAGSFLLTAVALVYLNGSSPDLPPWVDENGLLIPEEMPASFPVLDGNGDPVLDCDGEVVTLPTEEWLNGFEGREPDPDALLPLGVIEFDDRSEESFDVYVPGLDETLAPEC